MKLSRLVVVVAAAGALASGCASAGGGATGRATIWVTRDRGARVLADRSVPAGLTAIQALERVAKVESAYGGRFVTAVDGIASASHRDWFYYVNGYLADRGAADYRLHRGDVAWWDYRHWQNPAEDPVVVGAFPEPFVHGYDGTRRPVYVSYRPGVAPALARALARVVHGRAIAASTRPRAGGRAPNILFLAGGPRRFSASGAGAGGPVRFVVGGNAALLARDPHVYRFRYAVP